MLFGYLMMVIAITISAIAAWYSVEGLTAIFAAAVVPVIIMGGALEAGKITATVWLHNNWHRISWAYKTYLIPAIVFLMLLTSMGIFGFLSKAHSDQNLVSGDAMSKVAIYDEQIKTEKDNIDANKRALQQMDAQVDSLLGRTDTERGAERAVLVRKQQAKERASLQTEIVTAQKKIARLQEERAPLAAEFRKIEADVGPVKYIAAFVYGDNPDANVLERAVSWIIILIVIVFDPLALCLILASNKQLEWARAGRGGWIHDDEAAQNINPDPPGVEQRPWTEEEIAALNKQPDEIKTEEEFFDRARYAALSADILDEQRRAEEANAASAEIEKAEPDLDIPILENEEMWASRVIDEHAKNEEMVSDLAELGRPKYESDGGPLNTDQIEQIKSSVAEEQMVPAVAATGEPPVESPPPVDEFNTPIRRGNDYAVRYQGKVYNLDAFNSLHPSLAIRADNETLSNASQCGFGDKFPNDPMKGDMFIRTDYLPEKLFKWNGAKWIEVDKNSTDSYTYNQAYIQHLIQKLEAGEYEIEDLNDAEREQVEEEIEKIVTSKRV